MSCEGLICISVSRFQCSSVCWEFEAPEVSLNKAPLIYVYLYARRVPVMFW